MIRALLKNMNNIKVFVKTSTPLHFVRQSLPDERVNVIELKNDIGVVLKDKGLALDKDKTLDQLKEWVSSWDGYIHNEKDFCKANDINLILTDIAPQPLIVGKELDIPGINISNFTWHYIFSGIFGDITETTALKNAYEQADLSLVLPFNDGRDIFKHKKEVSLTSRKITVGRYGMRRKLGISNEDKVIYFGVGQSVDKNFLSNIGSAGNDNITLLVSSNADLPFKNVIRIPADATETQNYIAMCDLAVTKTGYSTVSEAIRGRVPLFLLKRDGFQEDETIARTVEKLGIGREIDENVFLSGSWAEEVGDLYSYTDSYNLLDERYIKDGNIEIVNAIEGWPYDVLE